MMNDIQLQNIDLNLLVVFEVLMDELSVVRAADRLARTPSAVSHSLARLRETFGDPLLVKAGGKMQPSPLALTLIEQVRPILRCGVSSASSTRPRCSTRQPARACSGSPGQPLMPSSRS
jgi:DNA-binding transcriptional LysR family regulator